MKNKVVVGVVAAVVVVGVGVYVASRDGGDSVQPGSPAVAGVAAPSAAPSQPVRAPGVFQDTSMLKPPAGAKVAIYEFDDLECPACAHALPIVHAAVERYKIPLVHRDYPLTEIHVWSFDAAVTARYLQDKVSPALADDFRRDVFANQNGISSKDDLARFTSGWFQAHRVSLPFVMDAACQNEVKADRALGDRLGVATHGTPCIFVVTQESWVEVTDLNQLYRMIDTAIAQTSASVTPVVDDRKRES
jgi:protein-disulfide isomerase